MLKIFRKENFKYIHISTDHIFSSKIKYFKENAKYRNINYIQKQRLWLKKIKNNKKLNYKN